MNDFTNIEYLKTGNFIQQRAYNVLMKYSIFELLQSFTPLLTGTIPIRINIENSDLDICCYYRKKGEFIEQLKQPGDPYEALLDYAQVLLHRKDNMK